MQVQDITNPSAMVHLPPMIDLKFREIPAAITILKQKHELTLANGGKYVGLVKKGSPHGKGLC